MLETFSNLEFPAGDDFAPTKTFGIGEATGL